MTLSHQWAHKTLTTHTCLTSLCPVKYPYINALAFCPGCGITVAANRTLWLQWAHCVCSRCGHMRISLMCQSLHIVPCYLALLQHWLLCIYDWNVLELWWWVEQWKLGKSCLSLLSTSAVLTQHQLDCGGFNPLLHQHLSTGSCGDCRVLWTLMCRQQLCKQWCFLCQNPPLATAGGFLFHFESMGRACMNCEFCSIDKWMEGFHSTLSQPRWACIALFFNSL